MPRRSVALLLVLLCAVLAAIPAVPLSAQQGDAEDGEAKEYGEQEFSPGLRKLRRAEIIMFGSLPITLFLSLEVYDTYRFVSNDNDPIYAPWPFRPPNAAPYSSRENAGIIISAVSASLLIALADYFIGRAREKRSEP